MEENTDNSLKFPFKLCTSLSLSGVSCPRPLHHSHLCLLALASPGGVWGSGASRGWGLLWVYVGALFVLCVELDVASTGNTEIHLKLVLINRFSSPSFFICDLSGERSENSHLLRMPAVGRAAALVLVAGERPEHWTLVACGLRTQHTVSRWCHTATSRPMDSGQRAMLLFGLVHDIMFSIVCALIELLSFLVLTLEKLFRYLIILTSIFNHDTCYCNKLDFQHWRRVEFLVFHLLLPC